MKKKIIGILIALLCLPLYSCSLDNVSMKSEYAGERHNMLYSKINLSNYYTDNKYEDEVGECIEWPSVIDGKSKRVHLIFNYQELKDIFEYSSGLITEDYFKTNLFKNFFVCCVAFYEFDKGYDYYNFKVNNNIIEFSITLRRFPVMITPVIHKDKELDFVIVNKDALGKNFDYNTNYELKLTMLEE